MANAFVSNGDYEIVSPECSYLDAAKRMAREGIHALYVIDNEAIVGVVCHIDFTYALASSHERISEFTVRDIMSSPVRVLHPEDSLEQVKLLFEQTKYVIFPVAGSGGRLLGAVSASDVFERLHVHEAEAASSIKDIGS